MWFSVAGNLNQSSIMERNLDAIIPISFPASQLEIIIDIIS